MFDIPDIFKKKLSLEQQVKIRISNTRSSIEAHEIENLSDDEYRAILDLPDRYLPTVNNLTKEIDDYLNIVMPSSHYNHSDDHYAYYKMPDGKLLGLWVANKFAYTGHGCIANESSGRREKELWTEGRASISHIAQIYSDAVHFTELNTFYNTCAFNGPFAKVSVLGMLEESYYIRSDTVSKDQYEKELALWLLKHR